MKVLPIFFLVLLILTSAYADTTPLPKDPNLDKPITLAVKGEALIDIMPMLADQTGAQLRVSKEIADQKATIFVDDKPLRDVMLGLETLFRYRWSFKEYKGKRIYELSMPQKLRKEREDGRQTGISDAIKRLDAIIRDTTNTNRYLSSPEKKIFADDLYSKLSQQAVKAIADGMIVRLDTESGEEEFKIPADVIQAFKKIFLPRFGVRRPEDQNETQIEMNVSLYFEIDSISVSMGAPQNLRIVMKGEEPDKPMHIGNSLYPMESASIKSDLNVVEEPLSRDGNPTWLTAAASITKEEIIKEAGLPGQTEKSSKIYANRSDILAILHRKAGMQIISDHYSAWIPFTPITENGIAKVLDSFADGTQGYYYGWNSNWGNDDRFLYMRTKHILETDALEVPNKLLRQWQSAYSTNGRLGLDELAEISLLTKDQKFALSSGPVIVFLGLGDEEWKGDSSGSEINFSKVTNSSNHFNDPNDRELAVILYGLLSPEQRKQAFLSGAGGFNADQRAMLARIIRKTSITTTEDYKKVGIYNRDGWRVDKQDPFNPSEAVAVRVTRVTEKDNNLTPVSVQSWNKGDQYKMTLQLADGTKKEIPFAITVPQKKEQASIKTNVQDPAVQD